MPNQYRRKIEPYVSEEISLSRAARKSGKPEIEFQHLENAHVLGQASTLLHTKVHILMFAWAIRNWKIRELLGQALRIVGAFTKTAFGLVPEGNTGGSNIGPFTKLPINSSYAKIIDRAKSNV
ncbi:DUF3703 domain-containing protein [Amphritea sp.]|uniref:DUF3703 domain-containing protein n=1 Tax=Amphritea sp. TaxID=1872502 RepID=UPI003A8CE16E